MSKPNSAMPQAGYRKGPMNSNNRTANNNPAMVPPPQSSLISDSTHPPRFEMAPNSSSAGSNNNPRNKPTTTTTAPCPQTLQRRNKKVAAVTPHHQAEMLNLAPVSAGSAGNVRRGHLLQQQQPMNPKRPEVIASSAPRSYNTRNYHPPPMPHPHTTSSSATQQQHHHHHQQQQQHQRPHYTLPPPTASETKSLGPLARRFKEYMWSIGGEVDLNDFCNQHTAAANADGKPSGTGGCKRRIYDVTNVLEGVGLIERSEKGMFKWKGGHNNRSSNNNNNNTTTTTTTTSSNNNHNGDDGNADRLQNEIRMMNLELQDLDSYIQSINNMFNTFKVPEGHEGEGPLVSDLYLRPQDIAVTQRETDQVLAIRAPPDTRLYVPPVDGRKNMGMRKFQIELTCPNNHSGKITCDVVQDGHAGMGDGTSNATTGMQQDQNRNHHQMHNQQSLSSSHHRNHHPGAPQSREELSARQKVQPPLPPPSLPPQASPPSSSSSQHRNSHRGFPPPRKPDSRNEHNYSVQQLASSNNDGRRPIAKKGPSFNHPMSAHNNNNNNNNKNNNISRSPPRLPESGSLPKFSKGSIPMDSRSCGSSGSGHRVLSMRRNRDSPPSSSHHPRRSPLAASKRGLSPKNTRLPSPKSEMTGLTPPRGILQHQANNELTVMPQKVRRTLEASPPAERRKNGFKPSPIIPSSKNFKSECLSPPPDNDAGINYGQILSPKANLNSDQTFAKHESPISRSAQDFRLLNAPLHSPLESSPLSSYRNNDAHGGGDNCQPSPFQFIGLSPFPTTPHDGLDDSSAFFISSPSPKWGK